MVQYLVKEVIQFPSDIECMRYIATIADKVNIDLYIQALFFSAVIDLSEVIRSQSYNLLFPEGAVEEVSPVHGDHCQGKRPAGS